MHIFLTGRSGPRCKKLHNWFETARPWRGQWYRRYSCVILEMTTALDMVLTFCFVCFEIAFVWHFCSVFFWCTFVSPPVGTSGSSSNPYSVFAYIFYVSSTFLHDFSFDIHSIMSKCATNCFVKAHENLTFSQSFTVVGKQTSATRHVNVWVPSKAARTDLTLFRFEKNTKKPKQWALCTARSDPILRLLRSLLFFLTQNAGREESRTM